LNHEGHEGHEDKIKKKQVIKVFSYLSLRALRVLRGKINYWSGSMPVEMAGQRPHPHTVLR